MSLKGRAALLLVLEVITLSLACSDRQNEVLDNGDTE